MKKTISTLLLLSMFALFTPVMPVAAANTLPTETTWTEMSESGGCKKGLVRIRTRTRTKTKVKNAILSGAGGLVIGAIAGGKRGALIGAGAGAGAYLTYRYVKDRRGKCVLRRA